MGKVMVIGLDAWTFDVVKPAIKKGLLPNMEKFFKKGVKCELESCIPPITSAAWTTFQTGCNPGKHGIFDFSRKDGEKKVNSTYIKSITLQEILSQEEKKVGIMNVPLTYPPAKVNGFVVTGLLTPSKKAEFYPKNLIQDFEKELGEYKIKCSQFKKGKEEEFFKEAVNVEKTRLDYATKLIEKHKPDFFFVMVHSTDPFQHNFWKHYDEKHPNHTKEDDEFKNFIPNFYSKIDELMGNFIKKHENEFDHVIILSDHGFGANYRLMYLNNWLIEKGYLKMKNQAKLAMRKKGFTIENVIKILKFFKIDFLIKKVPAQAREKIKQQSFLSFENVDWKNTQAYFMRHMGQLFLNKEGPVNENNYSEIRKKLKKELLSLKDPKTGEKLIKTVFEKEQVYSGKSLEDAPDLYVVPANESDMISSAFETTNKIVTESVTTSGDHRQVGIFTMHGPKIKKEIELERKKLVDIAPTILFLMNLKIEKNMDGQIISEAFEDEFKKQKIETKDYKLKEKKEIDLSQKQQEALQNRLKGLGYLG